MLSARSSNDPHSPASTTPPSPRPWATCTASPTGECQSPESSALSRPPPHRCSPRWPATPPQQATAGAAFLLLLVWLLLYLRISAPINRRLTAAADAHETLANARTLQRDWDRIIIPRAVLQGVAVAAVCAALILS
jgi:hypothetical protein